MNGNMGGKAISMRVLIDLVVEANSTRWTIYCGYCRILGREAIGIALAEAAIRSGVAVPGHFGRWHKR